MLGEGVLVRERRDFVAHCADCFKFTSLSSVVHTAQITMTLPEVCSRLVLHDHIVQHFLLLILVILFVLLRLPLLLFLSLCGGCGCSLRLLLLFFHLLLGLSLDIFSVYLCVDTFSRFFIFHRHGVEFGATSFNFLNFALDTGYSLHKARPQLL